MATDRASSGSFLSVSPDPSSRIRAPSLGGTSSTSSPAAASCWASRCPSPPAPSTRWHRSGCPRPGRERRTSRALVRWLVCRGPGSGPGAERRTGRVRARSIGQDQNGPHGGPRHRRRDQDTGTPPGRSGAPDRQQVRRRGKRVSRRALRGEGIKGSNQALNALAARINAELADAVVRSASLDDAGRVMLGRPAAPSAPQMTGAGRDRGSCGLIEWGLRCSEELDPASHGIERSGLARAAWVRQRRVRAEGHAVGVRRDRGRCRRGW
jgi:hypothetical protein